ncbi:hypothetical protein Ae201684P_009384 [Aphanomyces euteiches]|nr:hypothetical protein Ae201684P_009384 [Aphanomyces euteiches]
MTESSPKIGKIFIGGLSYETTDEKLRSYFGAYGTVTDAVVMKDPISRRSRGFGFITYADPACVDRALAQPNHVLDSRRAKRAVPRAESSRETSGSNSSRGSVSAGSISSSAVGATKKIFVGGLHYETKDDFKKYFQQFGKVVSAEVMFNRETNKSRGFGFVIFETEQSVELVLQDRGHVIDGKSVEVKRAVPRTDAPPSSSNSNRPLSARGSFSDVDPSSTPSRLLSPRSTPVSPMSGPASMSPSLPASSLGGYAAAVRYGGRPIPSPAPESLLLDAVEQLNIDDSVSPEQSRLFRPPVINGAFPPPPYPATEDPESQHWHQPQSSSASWKQWPQEHPTLHNPNVFGGGMFDMASSRPAASAWDPYNASFRFGLGFGDDAPPFAPGRLDQDFIETDDSLHLSGGHDAFRDNQTAEASNEPSDPHLYRNPRREEAGAYYPQYR